MTHSIIQKSRLEGALRLDAEYYQPEYFIDFSKGEWVTFGSQITCQYGLSLAMNDERVGSPMFKMDDINYGFLFDDKIRYANVTENEFEQYELNPNDVLFNRVNSEEFVGRTGIFKSDLKAVFASYLIRLKLSKGSKILADYLNLFLNSKFGIKQIHRFARRAVNQANVNAEELKQFKIAVLPVEFQRGIEKTSNEIWKGFQDSKKFYRQAEDLLLHDLGLKDFEENDDLFSIVNLSDVQKANRIDAEFFQTKYQKLIEVLKNKNKKSLTKVIENVAANFNPYLQPDKEFKYVELSDINSSIGTIESGNVILGKEAPGRAKRLLKENDVIISSIEGSLEKVALVSKDQMGFLASTGFYQFRSKEILPEVLLILAKSIVLQWQFKQNCAGTILTAVPAEALNQMIIPVLLMNVQQKIADLVKKSHSARQKSKELLEEAKEKVEEMIEKG